MRTKSLTIVDDQDKEVATLAAANGGAGLWINGPNGDLIAIYATNDGLGIGYYDKDHKKEGGMTFALGKGPVIQFRDEQGKLFFVEVNDLKKLINNHVPN
ncbi:MAG TPA: hypothetical protein VM260_19850 [Pirellula sp.]|nr:hypothetical protein [Pirellula sp.]